MFSKIFYLYFMISACVAEDVFESLHKTQKASRVTVCTYAREAPPCPGLVWTRRWTLVRAFCILPYQFESISVRRGTVNCSRGTGNLCSRQVMARYTHPEYPKVDLALLRLDSPYAYAELPDNRSISDNLLNKLDVWMKNVLFTESMKAIKSMGFNYHQQNYLKMYSTPMRMFLVTVMLPSASFIVFFLFIIFFTGKGKSSKIPYKNLNGNKKETTNV